ncbi:cobamide remodeling phosphodiesterase CbiR [uncultured Desulfovibrio sp.]|uniref:cobamide remodeling phosphodiesterase CbiR n=1 Tax=uncultured Desulfovibrio sp. TaxID=167968 RepID=UPI002602E548|nr:cobamide remodeling phosphodiesterase CbiR [uncultured Desulfovibrio sp.]
MSTEQDALPPLPSSPAPVAAPSFVMPDDIAGNVRFLAGRVEEVALCFFENAACLAYTEKDLPPDLRELPLRWHVHLPFDLPWPETTSAAACRPALGCVQRLLDKIVCLSPRCAVLHAPNAPTEVRQELLRHASRFWHEYHDMPLLLENTYNCDVLELGEGFLDEVGLGFCLDVGHLLGYAQHALRTSALPSRAALLHWSAPCGRDAHAALTRLTDEEHVLLRELMPRLSAQAVHLLEIFRWRALEESLPVLARLRACIA